MGYGKKYEIELKINTLTKGTKIPTILKKRFTGRRGKVIPQLVNWLLEKQIMLIDDLPLTKSMYWKILTTDFKNFDWKK